jgi:aminopeptidase N
MRRARTGVWISGVALAVSVGVSVRADTYPRQPNVDAIHYVFRVLLSDNSDEIEGETTGTFALGAAGVREIALDLTTSNGAHGMKVSDVRMGDRPLRFTHAAHRLTITLPESSAAGQRVQLTVRYRGAPGSGLRIGPNKYGERTFFALNWPDKAREWLPVVDHPSDKATSEFIVTAPAHYQVVANGLLLEELDLPSGMRRTHWRQGAPIATWLNAIGVARFASHRVGTAAGVPVETWVYPQDRDAGYRDFERVTQQVLAFFHERVGPYPYEKLANVEAAGLSGGTEHASAIFYGEKSVTGAARIDRLVAHEIAHQWFGNAVTERDWDDVWLSEGFATYFTLLFVEHAQGRDAFVEGLKRSRQSVLDFERKTPGYRIIHENLSDMSRVLSGQIYQKGGWTLHMLRTLIGTEPFWRGIREYYRRYCNGNASTDDFRRVMEELSGADLEWFFEQWLRRGETPRLDGGWRYDAATKQIAIDLAQMQANDPFRLTLDVAIDTAGAERRIERVELRDRRHRFTFAAETAPTSVTLDPNVTALMSATFEPR